jgi:hypothetical protein
LPFALPALLILQFINNSLGQDASGIITIDGSNPSLVSVEGRFGAGDKRNFWFLKDFGGYALPGDRISDVVLRDANGRTVEAKKLQPGEYLAGGDFLQWSYKIDLTPPKMPSAAAHISWIGIDRGIIMLDDILPQLSSNSQATVEFVLPAGWFVLSTEKGIGKNKFQTNEPPKAVFIVVKNFRLRSINDRASFVISDDWQFSDEEAAAISRDIYDYYKTLFGSGPADPFLLCLMKFPATAEAGLWEADTRRSTITVLSSDMPFKTQSLQRLHEQLRHEIFHLWIPNGINLSGNYDWFYEGFALYISLKNGVLMDRIRFDDFLDTLSRAFMIDSAQTPRFSLIEASQKRWSGSNTTVYARGMIVAFLCDLALLNKSKGKTDVSGPVKEIFEKYRLQQPSVDGNEAVLAIMKKHTELAPIVESYIKGNAKVVWSAELAAVGISAEVRNSVTVLKTVERPNGRQRQMLDKLGYNSWRKLTR